MVDKSDWQDVHRRLVADGRKQFAEPPTTEEVEALFAGKLSEADAERVREMLAYYPEMARAMTTEFPDPNAQVLTDRERAEDREKLRTRLRIPGRQPKKQLWFEIGIPIAAVLAGVIFAFVFYAPAHRGTDISTVAVQVLQPNGARGSEQTPIHVSQSAAGYHFKPVISHVPHYGSYRFDIVALDTPQPRKIWSRDDVPEHADRSFDLQVPGDVLPLGIYRIELYGTTANATTELATYTIRVVEN